MHYALQPDNTYDGQYFSAAAVLPFLCLQWVFFYNEVIFLLLFLDRGKIIRLFLLVSV